MTSPTQRSLKLMRERGYLCQVVEHFNMFAHIRQDLFGFIDILCLKENETVAIQCTSTGVSERVQKIADSPHVGAVRKAGWKIIVQGWRKGANGRYALREIDCS